MAKKESKKTRKVIWAIDPFSSDVETRDKLAGLLRQLGQSANMLIQPAYAMSLQAINWIGQMSSPNIVGFVPIAEEALEEILKSYSDLEFLPPKILTNKGSTRLSDVKILLKFAETAKADLIVLATHGREGVDRFFLGSFAEQVILHSKTPLLVVNPHMETMALPEHVLFSTDFSDSSLAAYRHFLKWAQPFTKKVTLFNQLTHPVDAFVQPTVAIAGGGWVSFEQYLATENTQRQKDSLRWKRITEKTGISFEEALSDSQEPVAVAALREAKQCGCQWIALGSESGPIAVVAIGSVVRNLVRTSPLPVWIVRH